MNAVEILKTARELIAKPERWTRGYLARNHKGEETGVFDPEATCWCAMGAVDKCSGGGILAANTLSLLYSVTPERCGVSEFNDSHTHAEVLDLFDRAIASAQKFDTAYEKQIAKDSYTALQQSHADLIATLDTIALTVSYIVTHGVGAAREPREDGQPQIVRVTPSELEQLIHKIGDDARAALKKAGAP